MSMPNSSSPHHINTKFMDSKTLITPKFTPLLSYLSPSQCRYSWRFQSRRKSAYYPLFLRTRFLTHVNPIRGVSYEEGYRNDQSFAVVSSFGDGGEDEEEEIASKPEDLAENESIWDQLVEIVKFSGPAAGLWLCGPLMSLIDTAVIGQSSSVELAALGPGTVLCDYMSYGFMFLSVATSNMVATSLAKQDKSEVQHQISTLLFVGLTSGLLMLFFTRFRGEWALSAFAGAKNAHMISAANTYVQVLWILETLSITVILLILGSFRVAFYSLLVYFATSMGTQTVAAHQARMLLKSLVIIGVSCGLILGAAGTIVPWLFPQFFSPDPQVIKEMHKVLLPYFIALSVTTSTHSLEGTLLAGRDLRFISLSMSTIFAFGALLLMSRFTVALLRLVSPNGILYSEDMTRYELGNVSTTT
ncbi:Multi antimicrobial extrusion protein [Cynara cardunculus var. scolymus]|uniref:Multi antimicrobial extrusion protein n=1 Tax=Cynara cardunculus var. scolymus TaxID=59895 RepID=A0A103XSB8_CYNCS|nr:Multi antimicrobial extrusion protein [Cynara cardunculus var. scolymus]